MFTPACLRVMRLFVCGQHVFCVCWVFEVKLLRFIFTVFDDEADLDEEKGDVADVWAGLREESRIRGPKNIRHVQLTKDRWPVRSLSHSHTHIFI